MLLDQILFHVPCPIFWKSVDGTFLGCSKSFLEVRDLHDYSQLIGKKDEDLPWSSCADEYYEDDQHVITTGETVKRVENMFLKDKVVILEITKTPLVQDDNIVGVLGVCADITDRMEKKRLETKNTVYEAELKAQKIFKDCINGIQNLIQEAKINAINNKTGSHIEVRDFDDKISVTKREQEILYFLSMWKSPKEIAAILSALEDKNVSYATISAFINKQLYSKFEVFNTSQLIEKATILKLIPFLHENLL